MTKIEAGKIYKNGRHNAIIILNVNIKPEDYISLSNIYSHNDTILAYNLSEKKFVFYTSNGTYYNVSDDKYDLIINKTITIDGKDIEISEESFKELKKQLIED